MGRAAVSHTSNLVPRELKALGRQEDTARGSLCARGPERGQEGGPALGRVVGLRGTGAALGRSSGQQRGVRGVKSEDGDAARPLPDGNGAGPQARHTWCRSPCSQAGHAALPNDHCDWGALRALCQLDAQSLCSALRQGACEKPKVPHALKVPSEPASVPAPSPGDAVPCISTWGQN